MAEKKQGVVLNAVVLWCVCAFVVILSGYGLYRQHKLEVRLSVLEERFKELAVQEKPGLEKKMRRVARDANDCVCPPETTHAEIYSDIVDEPYEQSVETPESQSEEFQSLTSAATLSALPQPASDLISQETEPKDAQATAAPCAEAPPEPPLDPELLTALGACTSDTPDFGESIHMSLANIWTPLLRKGLSKEDKDNLTKEYLIPSNCKLLQAPKLNAEIAAAISDIVRGRDKKLTGFQQDLGAGISAINRGMDTMLKTDNKVMALKSLSDGCRLLSNLHYCFTKDRTKLIIPSLEKNILHVIQDTERDDTLFGSSLAEKIKACKAIEKQGHQIRNKSNPKSITSQTTASRPIQQGNWTGPPRYLSNRGGRGGRGRAATTATRRHYPTTTTQTSTRSSNQLKPRANTQH